MDKGTSSVALAEVTDKSAAGRYIYAIAAIGSESIELGPVGIEANLVYPILYRDICAFVHDCSAEPYDSRDDQKVRSWLETHHAVVETIQRHAGTVIPLVFDTIIRSSEGGKNPDQVVEDWLRDDYDRLVLMLERMKGKDEYCVQIWLDSACALRMVAAQSDVLSQINKQIEGKSPGTAYLWKQKLEKVARAETDKMADKWSADFFKAVRKYSDDIRIEKGPCLNKPNVNVLNVSCLVEKARIEALGEELEKINHTEGFSVHFSGPWPPYSFVAKSDQTAGAK